MRLLTAVAMEVSGETIIKVHITVENGDNNFEWPATKD